MLNRQFVAINRVRNHQGNIVNVTASFGNKQKGSYAWKENKHSELETETVNGK